MSDPQAGPDASAAALRAEFTNLMRAAADEANLVVDRVKRATPGRYYASRMNQKALDHLQQVFLEAYPAAIEKRFAQLDRLNRKLARHDPGWTQKSADELRQPPSLFFRGAVL